MKAWTSWAVVVSEPVTKEDVLAVEGVLDGRDVPLFTGTLDEFCQRYGKPFTAHKVGRYIAVGGDA